MILSLNFKVLESQKLLLNWIVDVVKLLSPNGYDSTFKAYHALTKQYHYIQGTLINLSFWTVPSQLLLLYLAEVYGTTR